MNLSEYENKKWLELIDDIDGLTDLFFIVITRPWLRNIYTAIARAAGSEFLLDARAVVVIEACILRIIGVRTFFAVEAVFVVLFIPIIIDSIADFSFRIPYCRELKARLHAYIRIIR